jgi:hypothetical protein
MIAVKVAPSSPTSPVVTGSGSFDLRRAAGKVVVQNPHGFESVIFEPAGVFDRPAPDGPGSLPKGRPWIRADYDDGLTLDGAPPFLLACESADIGFFLAEAAWGARTAVPLGRPVVNHAPATGYLVHVDLERAVAAATGPRAQGFVRIAKLLKRIGWRGGRGSHQTMRLWVDRSGRVVAVRASLPLSGISDTVMTITRFGGLAVDPASPARNQVVDLAALTAGGDDGD